MSGRKKIEKNAKPTAGLNKSVKKISAFALLALALITGGVFAWQSLSVGAAAVKDTGEQIIVIDPNEDQTTAVNAYVKLTEEQTAIIKQRAERNITRVMEEGAALNEVEMREVTNHIVSTALSRVDVDLTAIYLTPGLYAESGAQAWCRPEYDEEAKQAKATIFVDRAAYDGAKNNTNLMVRYLFLLTHEVGHGIEPAYAEKPAALTGLVFNLLYDARLSVQPYIDYDPNTFIDERVANLYCCSLMLEEFGFALKGNLQMSADVEYLQIQMSYEQQYGGLITENARRLLQLLFPEISSRFNSQPIFGTSIANDVIAAYTAGVIAPNDKLTGLFDRGGSFGLPSYGEFIKYMDAAYGIGQIESGLKEEMINGISVTELKQFTLCAPFILGMKDTPYTDYSYDKYLDDLYAEHTDVTRMKDIDRMFVTDWAASMSNADFAKIIKPYL